MTAFKSCPDKTSLEQEPESSSDDEIEFRSQNESGINIKIKKFAAFFAQFFFFAFFK